MMVEVDESGVIEGFSIGSDPEYISGLIAK